ncbi:MAG: tetratricopeptide repeat protein [Thermoplasmata archaeon]
MRISVADRIVLHLLEYRGERGSFYLPREVTQQGIAGSIDASRASVTTELKTLKKNRIVEEESRRVSGSKLRMKCYFLTQDGVDHAQQMREAVLSKRVVLKDLDGKELHVDGAYALEEMQDRNMTAVRALEEIFTADYIDLSLYSKLPPERPFPLPERFFGRDIEIRELSEVMSQQKPLVIALMGVTGVGKTTLAAKVASEYKGASFFHRTHEWDSPSTIMRSLASFLRERGKERMHRYAKSFQPDPRELALILREDLPRGLLVFDDCHKSEHVQSFLSALMDVGESWSAKIVAVSRRKPSFYNRADVTVSGLVGEYNLNGLDSKAARELLEHVHGPLEDGTFERIYSLTEGHPMQLLLVSAERLSKAKADSDRDYMTYVHEAIAPELTHEEEEVLARCCVFRDSFPPEALGAVSQRIVEDLVERSILLEDGDNYAMHEMVREFVLKGLRTDERGLRRYHSAAADICLRREEEFRRLRHLIQAGRRPEALRLMRKRAAAFIARGLGEELLEMIEELQGDARDDASLTMIEAKANEAIGMRERALDLYEKAGELGGAIDKMEASMRIGALSAELDDFTSSEEFFEKALLYSKRVDNATGEANAYRGLGMLSLQKGEYDEAVRLLRMSKSRCSEERGELSRTLKLLGIAQLRKGELFAAQRSLEKSLEANQGDQKEEAETLNHLGTVLMRMKRMDEAGERFGQSAELAHRNGQMRTACLAMSNRANVLLELGSPEEATELCERSLEIASKLDDPEVTSCVYLTMANIFSRREKPDKAMSYLEKSIVLIRGSGDRHGLAERLFHLSEIKMSQGSKSEAMRLKEEGFRVLDGKLPR